MGTSTSVAQFTGKLDKLATELANVNGPLEATAFRGKQIFLAVGSSAGVIGKKPKGKRRIMGARYDMNPKGLGEGSAVVTYTGAAHLVNNATARHPIGARRRPGVRTRRRGAQALRFPDGGFASVVEHPGTRGKHFAEKAIAIAERELPKVYARKQLTEPLRRTFH